MPYLINFLFRTFFIIFIWTAGAVAHDVYLPVIIDTDGGADDIRAIAMLLNAGNVDIRLIVTSDGVLPPKQAQKSIQRLLACFDQTGIQVIAGINLPADPPQFRKLNESLNWPECAGRIIDADKSGTSTVSAIIAAANQSDNDLLYLCLGPMTNLAAALQKDPLIKTRFHRVIYLGSAPCINEPGADESGWNTRQDPESAQAVYTSGIPVYGLGLPDDLYLPFDDAFYDKIRSMDSRTARLLAEIHDFPEMRLKISQRHTKVWDEMVVIYINMLSAFDFEPTKGYSGTMQLTGYDAAAVKGAYLRLIGNPADFHLDTRESVVLREFPAQTEMMRDDVAPFVEDIIRRHGTEEWKACLLTNELHRHLGIYSLVGAKMGIQAREILEAPFDTLQVVSYAGLKPPLSCLNDGLQVSTGASLGRGTIRVMEENKMPCAEFIKGDIRLTLTLKPEFIARIKEDIRAAINRFGGIGPEYFAHIRKLSIQYWKDFDRNQLFEEKFSKK
jgi:pyrimidine-specific ribonucleoside hydrolase